MRVRLNGEFRDVDQGISISNLLKDLKVSAQSVVVELNRAIIKSDQFHSMQLKDQDQLEVVQFVGGGSVG